MPDNSKQAAEGGKAVGVYDRPASADFPKRAIAMVAVVAVIAFIAYWFLR